MFLYIIGQVIFVIICYYQLFLQKKTTTVLRKTMTSLQALLGLL